MVLGTVHFVWNKQTLFAWDRQASAALVEPVKTSSAPGMLTKSDQRHKVSGKAAPASKLAALGIDDTTAVKKVAS